MHVPSIIKTQIGSGGTRQRHKRTGSRSGRRWLAVLAAPAAITFMALLAPAGVASAATAAPAGGVPTVTIYLSNAPTYCADVHNNDNKAGGIVDLYLCKNAKNDHWLYVGGVACGTGGENICTEFIDTKNTSVCLSMNGARNVVLQNCGTNGGNPPDESLWIVDTGPENGWRNFSWGGNGDLAVAAVKQDDDLFGVNASSPCGCQFHWSVP